MNIRQKGILQILLKEQGKFLLASDMAEKENCSEKTVRNDLKVIGEYLEEHTTAKLIRKPGMGICLEIKAGEKADLIHQLFGSDFKEKDHIDKERIFHLAYDLLMGTEPMTIQKLAERYFVNKAMIKKDLEELEKLFHKWDIALVAKQKLGLSAKGTERDKRNAFINIEKTLLSTTSMGEFLKRNFPFHEVEIVKNELQQFQKDYHIYFTDDTLEQLLFHILLMMKRTKLKQYITVSEKERSLVIDKKEYQQTANLLGKLEDYFVMHFPEDEIVYLTIHILSGKVRYRKNTASKDTYIDLQTDQFVAELVKQMSDYTKINFTSDPILLEGLHIHIYSALHRVQSELVVDNPMLSNIKKMYPYMFHSVMEVLEDMEGLFIQTIPEEEAAYLVLHFQAALERLDQTMDKLQKAVIVCHLGVGMSQLLQVKLERKFRSFHILDCIAKVELTEYLTRHRVDFVISTIELEDVNIPYTVVSPLLEHNDVENLRLFLRNFEKQKTFRKTESVLVKYTNPSLLFLQVEPMHRYELIEELGTALYYQGYVEKYYQESAAVRERASATNIGGGIAIPHGSPHFIKKPVIAIATLKEPIEWGEEKVSIVFMLALGGDEGEDTKQIFREISFITEDLSFIQSLLQESNKEQFLLRLTHQK